MSVFKKCLVYAHEACFIEWRLCQVVLPPFVGLHYNYGHSYNPRKLFVHSYKAAFKVKQFNDVIMLVIYSRLFTWHSKGFSRCVDFKEEGELIYRLLSRCSITVAAFVLAGRCSVTVLLPLSKWLFFGLLLRWFPSSLKWWPKWVSRVILEWSSFNVSPFRFAELTLTDALIGFITCLTGAVGGGVDDNVEQLAASEANKDARLPEALPLLAQAIIDIGIDIVPAVLGTNSLWTVLACRTYPFINMYRAHDIDGVYNRIVRNRICGYRLMRFWMVNTIFK